ncbi:peptidoglycan synthetase FtsI [Quadrisphaera granulorum]|uniref:Peptidoglycan synthetase FtsI n=1 Tax=Quadrisphaera granulorum TaxID=317664 RepID=A0A316A873_9ACTN|nr:penicillin-binding protein 2 [Quadrisphaera granulorum]PWJ53682.1 peptidoglycan synthetase FtsI [Quadrisphaera granulorum]SZE96726.1 peptidoglycan synthetase FtsI [Quadrisphaera granulorum]
MRGRTVRAGRPERRAAVIALVLLLVTGVFTGRLLQVQALDTGQLAEDALAERLAKVTLPAQRGSITDRNGNVLAESVERVNVTANPNLFRGPQPDAKNLWTAPDAAAALAPLLNVPESELAAQLAPRDRADGKPLQYVILAKRLTPEQWRAVDALGIPGIFSERAEDRTYPAGTTAGNLVGYVSRDGTALAGLELAENDTLSGTDGEQLYEQGRNGQRIPLAGETTTPAVDGKDVRLTLDEDIQFYAQNAARAQAEAAEADWVSVVVMAKDGQVLALAESGSIDPADPGATPEAERHNRSLEDTFEPGSTGKLITAAAAIQEGLATPETQLTVPDRLQLPGRAGFVRDSHPHDLQKLTFAGVLAESSNVGTIEVGQKLTVQQRYDYLRAFGIGQKVLGLPGETRGILGTPDSWKNDARTPYNVLFGQGYGVNALQAAQVYATIANGGVRIPAHVVAGTTDADGTYTPATPGTGTRVVSEATAQQVTAMLEGVVTSDGTGLNAAVPGFRVAGKTGTAQDLPATRATGTPQYTSSFIGMAPADDPQLVVAVIVQHPQTSHYGGTVAAPVFSDVMGYALGKEGITPSGAPAQLPPLTWQ